MEGYAKIDGQWKDKNFHWNFQNENDDIVIFWHNKWWYHHNYNGSAPWIANLLKESSYEKTDSLVSHIAIYDGCGETLGLFTHETEFFLKHEWLFYPSSKIYTKSKPELFENYSQQFDWLKNPNLNPYSLICDNKPVSVSYGDDSVTFTTSSRVVAYKTMPSRVSFVSFTSLGIFNLLHTNRAEVLTFTTQLDTSIQFYPVTDIGGSMLIEF